MMTTLTDDVVTVPPANREDRQNGSAVAHGSPISYPVMAESDLDAEFPAEIGRYEDFHTIDWQRDLARDRMRHRQIIKGKSQSCSNRIAAVLDAGSGWICVLLVGITAGVIAGMMDIGTYWLSDLKDGLCKEAFYMNKEQCCWAANDTYLDAETAGIDGQDPTDKCTQVTQHSTQLIYTYFIQKNHVFFSVAKLARNFPNAQRPQVVH